MGVGAHASLPLRRQLPQILSQTAIVIEQCLWPVAAQPCLQLGKTRRIVPYILDGHLVRPPAAFDAMAVDLHWSGPAFGRAQHDHRPARSAGNAAGARRLLVLADA